jgi:gas vesicle protein
MSDKKRKIEELSVFIQDLDDRVSSQWEQWKNELYYKLETMCETQEELDELVEHLKKQNIGGITDDALRIAAEDLENEKFN